jgi:hypothetical protein
MKKGNVKSIHRPRATPQEVQKILARTDWATYLENVDKRVMQEVDAYEVARAKSLEAASHQVFL